MVKKQWKNPRQRCPRCGFATSSRHTKEPCDAARELVLTVLAERESGMTLEAIGKRHLVTRERIRGYLTYARGLEK